jgi:hypothetical protein
LGSGYVKEALIYSHIAATAALRDEMQGVTRRQGLFSLTSGTTRQFARQAQSHAGCGQIGRSLSCTAWHRSPSYDLRRTRRDLPDLTRNAAHGGIDQRFLKEPLIYSHIAAMASGGVSQLFFNITSSEFAVVCFWPDFCFI